jgi:hypothetical protein
MKDTIFLLLISFFCQCCVFFEKPQNPNVDNERITNELAGNWQMKKYMIGGKDSTYCLRTQIWDGTITCHIVNWSMTKGNSIRYGVIYQGLNGEGYEYYGYDSKTGGMRFPVRDSFDDTTIFCGDYNGQGTVVPIEIASPFGDSRKWSINRVNQDSLILISSDTIPQREIYLKLKK